MSSLPSYSKKCIKMHGRVCVCVAPSTNNVSSWDTTFSVMPAVETPLMANNF